MEEGNIFSLCVSSHPGDTPIRWQGGYPIRSWGGTPSFPMGGTPSFLTGVPHPSQWGVPPSFLKGVPQGTLPHHWDWMGVPHWDWMGVPHWDWMEVPPPPPVRTGFGYNPPHWMGWMGVPPSGLDRGTLPPPHHTIRTGCGSPPPPPVSKPGDRAATRRAVCLLHSGRRNFLWFMFLTWEYTRPDARLLLVETVFKSEKRTNERITKKNHYNLFKKRFKNIEREIFCAIVWK